MKEIIVKTQAELDAIPEDFDGVIKIRGEEKIIITKKFIYNVRVYSDSSGYTYGNSIVFAYDNSSVYADDNSIVTNSYE